MGIVDRILDGKVSWEEIFLHNIGVMDIMIAQERANKHNPDDCPGKRKYCKHGNKRFIQEMLDHRATLKREFNVIRTGALTP